MTILQYFFGGGGGCIHGWLISGWLIFTPSQSTFPMHALQWQWKQNVSRLLMIIWAQKRLYTPVCGLCWAQTNPWFEKYMTCFFNPIFNWETWRGPFAQMTLMRQRSRNPLTSGEWRVSVKWQIVNQVVWIGYWRTSKFYTVWFIHLIHLIDMMHCKPRNCSVKVL